MKFPTDFRWGAATASYQIEGATKIDGRGESIWDRFAATPGKVVGGDNGDVACDHYHRYPEDIALMKELGLSDYRLSIAWPRLFPNGDAVREQRGFDFYNRLIDAILEAGITPLVTAYHWDLPQSLQDQGGWANREIALRFADYSGALVEAFGDRVSNWMTINEPWCVSWLGYKSGVHAPGVQDLNAAIAAAHHTALAHGLGARAMRAANSAAKVGMALNMTNYRVSDPTDSELTTLAALMDSHINRWWLDAAVHGHYPQNLVEEYGDRLQRVFLDGDERLIKVQMDSLGINYYSDSFLATPRAEDVSMADGGLFPFKQRANGTPPGPLTDMGWPVTPQGLEDLIIRIAKDWPEIGDLVVSENGAAYPEEPDANGVVNDQRRVDYLTTHLEAAARAIERGAPLKGYYAWSLLDNYEWAEGYAKRFGLIHVDYQTLKRTPKESARAYASIISANKSLSLAGGN